MGLKDFLWTSEPSKDGDEKAPEKTVAAPVARSGIGAPVAPAPLRPIDQFVGGMFSGNASAVAPTLTIAPVVDENIVKDLEASTAKSKVPGYVEFRKMYTAMSAIPEAVRIPAVLAALQAAQNISLQNVVASVDDRIQLLDAEREAFTKAVAQANADGVGAITADIQRTTETISARETEIQSLRAALMQKTVELQHEQARIAGEEQAFLVSFTHVRQTLQNERDTLASIPPSPK